MALFKQDETEFQAKREDLNGIRYNEKDQGN